MKAEEKPCRREEEKTVREEYLAEKREITALPSEKGYLQKAH
jgi:hypothetical protein